MSLNFTVQNVVDFPDGKYRAQIDHIEHVSNEYGNYPYINFKILDPLDFEGRVHQEKYKIEHSNSTTRHIAIKNFSNLCVEVGGLKVGDEVKDEDLLFKIVDIWIRNNQGKDGRSYANIVKVELVENNTSRETAQTILDTHAVQGIAGSGMQPFQSPALPSDALNDQVPF